MTAKEAPERHFLIHLCQVVKKPNLESTAKRKTQSTLSQAFIISSLATKDDV